MLVSLTFDVASDYTTSDGDKPMLDNVADGPGASSAMPRTRPASNMTAYVTGDAAISSDMESSSMNDMAIIEPLTIIIIIVLMGVLFRSVVAQWIPLGAVGVALGRQPGAGVRHRLPGGEHQYPPS